MTEELQMEEFNGCLWVWEEATDFLFEDGDIDDLPNLYDQDDVFFEYNQNDQERSKKSCTIFNAVGAVSDLMNYQFSLDEIKKIDELSYKKWRVRGAWRSTKSAVDLVFNRRNSNEELVKKYWKIAYYRINMMNDELVQKILDKNYTICRGFQWNSKYQNDYRSDGVLDWYEFGTKTYWHSVGLRNKNWKKHVKDNYKWRMNNWRSTNFYEIKPLCSEEVSGGTFYYWWYLFTKVAEDNFEELQRLEKFKTKLNIAITTNSELRHLTNDQKYKDRLHSLNENHRKKMIDIENEVKKHS